MAEQNYSTENPEVRKVVVQKNEDSVEPRVSPARPDYALDLSDDQPVSETVVSLDEVVLDPNSPLAVIVPPEGRGTHPQLGADGPTAEEQFASGDAPEATGVLDGKVVTAGDEGAAERAE
jgi:hypothetical protein